jgi:hypothetical protein
MELTQFSMRLNRSFFDIEDISSERDLQDDRISMTVQVAAVSIIESVRPVHLKKSTISRPSELLTMLRPLCDPEPFLARCNQLTAAMRVSCAHSTKDIARTIIERSPLFSMQIRDGHLWKVDPILTRLPESITSLSESLEWIMANRTGNAGDLAFGKDILVGRVSHALSDGGHWVDALTFDENTPVKRSRTYIHTIPELFGTAFEKFTTPCTLDLANKGIVLNSSYAPRQTAAISDVTWHGPLESFACFDPKRKRPVKMTEHSWASILVAALIHNWRTGARLDLTRSGIITLVNLRRYIPLSVDRMNIGNCYSRVVPHAGTVSLDETLESITERLRRMMDRQLKDWEAVKVMRAPLAPPPGAPVMLSNPGVIALPSYVVETMLHEVVGNVEPEDTSEWALLSTEQTLSYAGKLDQWIYTHFNTMLTSQEHGERLHALILKGLQRITLDQTLRKALETIDPAIKGML